MTVPANPSAFFWPQDRIDRLCDMIADGASFAAAAHKLGVTKNAAVGQFNRIRQRYGWQAA